MKKALYLGFCLVLAMGVDCAITDYDLIVDNDQVSNGPAVPRGKPLGDRRRG